MSQIVHQTGCYESYMYMCYGMGFITYSAQALQALGVTIYLVTFQHIFFY